MPIILNYASFKIICIDTPIVTVQFFVLKIHSCAKTIYKLNSNEFKKIENVNLKLNKHLCFKNALYCK